MALKLQRGKRRPNKIPHDLLFLIPPWISTHPVWMPTCFQSCLLSCSLIYTNVTVSPPFTLYWGSSLAAPHLVHSLSRGGKNTSLLYASLRQDSQGVVPVTHFGFFCAPQVAQSRFFFFFFKWMRMQAATKRKKRTQILLGGNTETVDLLCRHSGFMNSSLLSPDLHKSKSQESRLLYFSTHNHSETCTEMFHRRSSTGHNGSATDKQPYEKQRKKSCNWTSDHMKTTCELLNKLHSSSGWFISHINITMFIYLFLYFNRFINI